MVVGMARRTAEVVSGTVLEEFGRAAFGYVRIDVVVEDDPRNAGMYLELRPTNVDRVSAPRGHVVFMSNGIVAPPVTVSEHYAVVRSRTIAENLDVFQTILDGVAPGAAVTGAGAGTVTVRGADPSLVAWAASVAEAVVDGRVNESFAKMVLADVKNLIVAHTDMEPVGAAIGDIQVSVARGAAGAPLIRLQFSIPLMVAARSAGDIEEGIRIIEKELKDRRRQYQNVGVSW